MPLEGGAANAARIESWLGLERRRIVEPSERWKRVRCPVLIQWGEADTLVPEARSAAIIGAALRDGGNSDVTLTVLPHGDHGLFETQHGTFQEIVTCTRLAGDALRQLHDWIASHVMPRLSS